MELNPQSRIVSRRRSSGEYAVAPVNVHERFDVSMSAAEFPRTSLRNSSVVGDRISDCPQSRCSLGCRFPDRGRQRTSEWLAFGNARSECECSSMCRRRTRSSTRRDAGVSSPPTISGSSSSRSMTASFRSGKTVATRWRPTCARRNSATSLFQPPRFKAGGTSGWKFAILEKNTKKTRTVEYLLTVKAGACAGHDRSRRL